MIRGVPYDAEVEYLESTGTQWIDTLINADSNMSVEITMANVSTPWNNVNPMGAILATPRRRHHLNFAVNGVRYFFGVGDGYVLAKNVKPSDGDVFTFKVDVVNKTFTLGSFLGTFPNDTFDTGVSYWLFGRNGTTPPYLGSLRIYSAKLWNGSTLVRDFIPVRVGTTGYLYDRVTRRLFRNQGTGAFRWGPDVATPVMALHMYQRPPYNVEDYIRNGLLGIWDGINNVKVGIHDPTTTKWRDLISGIEAELTDSSPAWVDDGFNFAAGNRWFRFALPSHMYDAIVNNHVTCECCVGAVTVKKNEHGMFGVGGRGYQRVGFNLKFNTYSNYAFDFNARGGSTSINSSSNIFADSTHYGLVDGTRTVLGSNNVILRQATKTDDTVIPDGDPFLIGAWVNSSTYKFGGIIHCVRFYNRALTAEEIAHNYAVDKERFRLP